MTGTIEPMHVRPCGWALFVCLAATALAAHQGPSAVPQLAGIETPWDVRKTISSVLGQADQLGPLLTAINPQEWVTRKGAPDTYISQQSTAQRQLNDVTVATRLFSQNVESLSLGLDLYFRLEALDVTARSLQEGAREYSTRALADKLAQLLAANFTSREQFQVYLRDLAKEQEQSFKIADEEAQRCRGIISKEPTKAASHNRKKN